MHLLSHKGLSRPWKVTDAQSILRETCNCDWWQCLFLWAFYSANTTLIFFLKKERPLLCWYNICPSFLCRYNCDQPLSWSAIFRLWAFYLGKGKGTNEKYLGNSKQFKKNVRCDVFNSVPPTLTRTLKSIIFSYLQMSFSASSNPNWWSKASCIRVFSWEWRRHVRSRFRG